MILNKIVLSISIFCVENTNFVLLNDILYKGSNNLESFPIIFVVRCRKTIYEAMKKAQGTNSNELNF